MSLHLNLVPANPAELAQLRADPSALGSVLGSEADADRHALRHGPVVHLRALWHVLHLLVTRGDQDGPPELQFLLRGGEPVGDHARAFRSDEVKALSAAIDAVPGEPAPRFDPEETRASGVWFYASEQERGEAGVAVARERLDEVQALLRAADGYGLLVLRHAAESEVTVDLHLVPDATIRRYQQSPELLDAHLGPGPELPSGGAVVRSWYALHVGLTELGDSPAHRFLEDGGELVDEALQLRGFEPDQVSALDQLLADVEPDVLRAALTPAVLEREGLDPEEIDELMDDYPALRARIASWARSSDGMVTFLT